MESSEKILYVFILSKQKAMRYNGDFNTQEIMKSIQVFQWELAW